MNEDEEQHVYFTAARVSKALRSKDYGLVESLFRVTSPVIMYKVYSIVVHDLSIAIDTPDLDRLMKRSLKGRRDTVRTIFRELQTFLVTRGKINRMKEGYPKYQAMMNLLGKDPKLTYHQWADLQVQLQLER